MPTSSAPDDTPAWIKGDLPAAAPDPSAAPPPNSHLADSGKPEAPITAVGVEPKPLDPAGEPGESGSQDQASQPAELSIQSTPEPANGVAAAEPVALTEAGARAELREPDEPTEPDEPFIRWVPEPPNRASAAAAETQAEAGAPPGLAAAPPSTPAPEPAARMEAATEPETSPGIDTFPEAQTVANSPARDNHDQSADLPHVEALTAAEPPIPEPLSLEALIESLLFVADGAVPVGRLAEALEVPARDVEAALAALGQGYRQHGLSLQRFRDKVQLTTSPSAANQVERCLGLAAATPLSRAALETLAIVAYQQPVTRPQIEAVRGVNSDSVIKNLLSKGLIEDSGRAEGPGRPVLYSTTPEFMQHFGLASLADLPPLSLSGPESVPNAGRILKG